MVNSKDTCLPKPDPGTLVEETERIKARITKAMKNDNINEMIMACLRYLQLYNPRYIKKIYRDESFTQP